MTRNRLKILKRPRGNCPRSLNTRAGAPRRQSSEAELPTLYPEPAHTLMPARGVRGLPGGSFVSSAITLSPDVPSPVGMKPGRRSRPTARARVSLAKSPVGFASRTPLRMFPFAPNAWLSSRAGHAADYGTRRSLHAGRAAPIAHPSARRDDRLSRAAFSAPRITVPPPMENPFHRFRPCGRAGWRVQPIRRRLQKSHSKPLSRCRAPSPRDDPRSDPHRCGPVDP